MQQIDWIVLGGTLLFIVLYGTYKTRGSKNVTDYLKGGNEARWWTIGLSVMATQASAITFLSTPGQAFHDGMGFVQFYFGLPIAMVVICLVFIPIYHKLKVFTAYEYLESRFDRKTRTLTAILFLIQRGLAAGITIFAPAIILSAVLGWNLLYLNIIIGTLVIIYTVSGGTKAVSVTQKQQMAVIFGGMFIAFLLILNYLPLDISFTKALDIAGAGGKMDILDFSFDFNNRYTFWSGIIGGSFLALSYFGTDQSQVQRYLSGKSVRQSQMGLIFNGLLKVPMQFFILLVGVMVFVFYQFNSSPLHFNPAAEADVLASEYASDYEQLQKEKDALDDQLIAKQLEFARTETLSEKEMLQEEIQIINITENELREQSKALILKANPLAETNDKDYVFIHFILNNLPRGLIGLLLAVILSAAMSSTASELNALGSTTTIDLYKRSVGNRDEKHFVRASKWFTLLWGVIAILVASVANLFDNLIQLVNIIGSIFYGNILGVFLLAFFFKYVKGNAVFTAALINQVLVIALFLLDKYELINLPYLWLNFVGCVTVIAMAFGIQRMRETHV
ncbi:MULTISPECIES: sodium:solute symporter [Altibacter]|uniref:sodium:solute symporter n=1 Tax=Altibacter TaxID=1535231 RepID=UPI0005528853|nr:MULTISPECIES: sodium:solute symporter [Altibacter]MCW8980261.1 sodium:solute symporter [Altibacter sp.]MCW9037686.1 sodium:solute symporter [Altibacter sp.]